MRYNYLTTAAMLGCLRTCSFTIHDLCLSNANGRSVLHVAASFRRLDQIPREMFNLALLSTKDNSGWTIAHEAALRGNLDQVPAGCVNSELFKVTDIRGWSVAHEVSLQRHMAQIKMLEVHLTHQLLQMTCRNGCTVAHALARGGNLHKLTAGIVDDDFLKISDANGWTVAHEAARYGQLHQLPAHLLTRDLLGMSDKEGRSVRNVRESFCV